MNWVHKYKPRKFENVIEQEHIVDILSKIEILPHMIFHGPVGCGKTIMSQILIRKLYGDNIENKVLHFDASCDFTIEIVRVNIKNFARTKSKGSGPDYKMIIIEDADTLSISTQLALFRIIENYSHITRFCLICNSINKLLDSLKSRCAALNFYPISDEGIRGKLKAITEVEELEYVNIDKIVRFANGDMRKAIVNLQFGIRDIPMDNLLKAIEERKFDGIQESIYELMDNRYSGRRIFRKIFKIVMDRPEICYTCSKVDGQCNETIQLLKVCSHFT
jgi:DNA polymerase III delta prime subunit